MLQDMDDMEPRCDFNVKDSTFDQLEQHKISMLTVTRLEILIIEQIGSTDITMPRIMM
jgi:hypothetical protein